MGTHNRFVVAKGQRVSHGRENYKAGRKFPAAKLGISEESLASLIRDGAIFDPAELRDDAEVAAAMEDGLEDYTKPDLIDMAGRYGIDVKSSWRKDEIILAIRSRQDPTEPDEVEEPEE